MNIPRAVIEFNESENGDVNVKLLLDGVEKHIPSEELSPSQAFAVLVMMMARSIPKE